MSEENLPASAARNIGIEVAATTGITPNVPARPIDELRKALVLIDDQRQALAEAGDIDGLAWGLSQLDLLVGDMRAIERAGRGNVAALMDSEWEDMGKKGRPRREVPGLGVIEVWGGSERKNWQSERLLQQLILSTIVDENGELRRDSPLLLAERIYAVLVACLPITASLSWKVGQHGKGTGLRGQGIDPAMYCDEVEAPRLAKIPKQPKES